MEIGQKLKDKRMSLGLSQEQLAEQIGVTRQTIANWEKGKTYPDIGSVMKLSDLYNVSLDELLKEDASMRKHVEDSVALPRKYWNILFEVAILLIPFGLLVAYWGAYWVGLVLQTIGLAMLPPLWIVRHRLFGMSKEDMCNSLIGWALFVGAAVLRGFCGDQIFVQLIASIMSIVGLMMVYGHGVYLERGTRFWLVIFLYIGIPIFVLGSLFLGQLSESGAFSKAQPFGHNYRIVTAEIGQAPAGSPVIELSQRGTLIIDGDNHGKCEYIEPAKYQQDTVNGIWHLVPDEDPNALYKLEVSSEDRITLSYLVDDQLLWRWELKQIPKVWFALDNTELTVVWQMDWFNDGIYDGDPATVNHTTHSGAGTAYIQCRAPGVTELTVKEEYRHGESTEYRDYVLIKDKNDNFPLPDSLEKRYEDGKQSILYRIQWEGGEYLFCIHLE